MKHKLIFFAIAVFLCFGLISCNQAMAGLPEWLPEEVMDQPVQQFEAVYTAEGSLVCAYYCIPKGDGSTIKYSYHPGEPLEQMALEKPSRDTVLAMKDMPVLIEALEDWVLENEAGMEVSLSYLLPQYSFLEDAEYPEKKLSVSLETGEMRVLEGDYAGSKEYGAIDIAVGVSMQNEAGIVIHPYEIKYIVYIDA